MNELPSGWALAITDALFTFVTSGSRGWARYYSDEGAPFIRVGNLRRASITPDLTDLQRVTPPAGAEGTRTQVLPDDILISITADLGRVALMTDVKETAYINQHIALARPVKQINARYVAWYLSSDMAQQQWGKAQRGVTKLGLGLDDIRSVEIPIAPLAEQERIVAAIEEQFSRLDAGAAALERVLQKLKQLRSAMLEAATEGRLTVQWRSQYRDAEPAEILIKHLLDQRRQVSRGPAKRAGTSSAIQLPALPGTWSYTTIEPLLSVDRPGMKTGPFGSLLKKHEHLTEGVPVLGIENVEPMRFVPGSRILISHDKAEDLSTYDVQPGDVLISRSGTVGEVCVAPQGLGEARFSTNLIRLVLNADGMLPSFFALLFNGSPAVLAQVYDLCKGTTRAFLNQEILSTIIFPVPPLAEQREILSRLDEFLSGITTIEHQVTTMLSRVTFLKRSLLSDAYCGKLVTQDSGEESATFLLERIAVERASSKANKSTQIRELGASRGKVTA